MTTGALSKERIAELDSLQLRQIADRYREGGWVTPPEMTQRQAETILALIVERERDAMTVPIQGRVLMSEKDARDAVADGVLPERIGVVVSESGDWVPMENLVAGDDATQK